MLWACSGIEEIRSGLRDRPLVQAVHMVHGLKTSSFWGLGRWRTRIMAGECAEHLGNLVLQVEETKSIFLISQYRVEV